MGSTCGDDWKDWLLHALLPFAACAALAVSAFAAPAHARVPLFCLGGAALRLLFIGIHNAWDAVADHVFVHMRNAKD